MKLEEQNYKELQSLLAKRQKELEREGITPQLAYRKAAQEVGALFTPVVSGEELSKFIAGKMSAESHANKFSDRPQFPFAVPAVGFGKAERAEWPVKRQNNTDTVAYKLRQAIGSVEVGETVALPCSEDTAKKAQRQINNAYKAFGGWKFVTTYKGGRLYCKRTK